MNTQEERARASIRAVRDALPVSFRTQFVHDGVKSLVDAYTAREDLLDEIGSTLGGVEWDEIPEAIEELLALSQEAETIREDLVTSDIPWLRARASGLTTRELVAALVRDYVFAVDAYPILRAAQAELPEDIFAQHISLADAVRQLRQRYDEERGRVDELRAENDKMHSELHDIADADPEPAISARSTCTMTADEALALAGRKGSELLDDTSEMRTGADEREQIELLMTGLSSLVGYISGLRAGIGGTA